MIGTHCTIYFGIFQQPQVQEVLRSVPASGLCEHTSASHARSRCRCRNTSYPEPMTLVQASITLDYRFTNIAVKACIITIVVHILTIVLP